MPEQQLSSVAQQDYFVPSPLQHNVNLYESFQLCGMAGML